MPIESPERWIVLQGVLGVHDGVLDYQGATPGATVTFPPPNAVAMSNLRFSGGRIGAEITIHDPQERSECELIIYDDPSSNAFVTVGLGGSGAAFSVRHWIRDRGWTNDFVQGWWGTLEPGRNYRLEVLVNGANVQLMVDNVNVGGVVLPSPTAMSNVGVWIQGHSRVTVSNYHVETVTPSCFVIMQFSEPYNALYSDVIQKVCEEPEFKIRVTRADDISGPGLIIADIIEQIINSNIVIADITPANRNVYFEVGYAYAYQRPMILVAEKGTDLPFDLRGHRVVFYEDSIAGKSKIERDLRRHLLAILAGRA